MNKVLLLFAIILLAFSSVAMADLIGVYSDATGSSCLLAPGFSPNTAVVHKFSVGATASRFNITFPPGSSFFAFNSTYPVPVPVAGPTDLAITYGGNCRMGSFMIGTIVAILSVGVVQIVPGTDQINILYTDCDLVTRTASGGRAWVGSTGDCDDDSIPVEGATWGKVKSLYR